MKFKVFFFSSAFLLNVFAVSDYQIRTAEDVRFCGGSTQNANMTPSQLADNGSVWRTGNRRWNQAYEDKFAQWVEENVDAGFFQRFNLETDCADAALSIRAIFARIHSLPVMFVGGHYSNFKTDFARYRTVKNWTVDNWKESLMNDKRFRQALRVWNGGFGTINIHADTYQLKIRQEADSTRLDYKNIKPGRVLLSGGHTRFVKEIDSLSWNPITELSSTVPAKVRKLSEGNMSLYSWPAKDSTEKKPDRGILGWNWIVNCGGKFKQVRDSQMPDYSNEQANFHKIYKSGNFRETVQGMARAEVLKNPKKEHFEDMINKLINSLEARIEVVQDGYAAAQRNPQRIRNTDGGLYDAHSTPGRDSKTLKQFKSIIEILVKYQSKVDITDTNLLLKLLKHKLEYKPGSYISSYHFLFALSKGKISSEPWDNVDKRWGMDFIRNERFTKFNESSHKAMDELKEFEKMLYAGKEKVKSYKKSSDRNFKRAGYFWSPMTSPIARFFLRRGSNYSKKAKNQEEALEQIKKEIMKTKAKIEFINNEKIILEQY